MSKVKLKCGTVQFPAKERAFVISSDKNAPFDKAVIGITYPDPNYRMERDAMPDLAVFEYIVEGEGEIFTNGEWIRVTAGDTYILAPGVAHRYRASQNQPFKKYWVNYISDYMPPYLAAYGLSTGVFHADTRVYFEKLMALTKNPELTNEDVFSISEYIHAIVAKIAKTGENESTADKIKEILLTSVYGKLSLDAIARELHISKSSVIRAFKKKYEMSPYDFLLNAKLEVAKTLLRTTRLTVAEIADKIQILDEHYFSTLFLKKIGMRPLKYRSSASNTKHVF